MSDGYDAMLENAYQKYLCPYSDDYEDCDGDCGNCDKYNQSEIDNELRHGIENEV